MTTKDQLGKLAQEQLGLERPPELHTVHSDPHADHSDEAAAITRDAIARFGTGEMDALASAENFFQVYFDVEKNRDKRPLFVRKVADEETLEHLFGHIGMDGDDTLRRVSLGLLNRMASEPVAGPLLTTETRLARLLGQGTRACGDQDVQTQLMWLETINSILPRALDISAAGATAMQSGFTDAALGLIVVPEKDATEESQVYGELRGLLAAKCLGFLVGAPNVASALGRDYLSRQLAVISGTEDWKRPETLATHARLLLQNSARLPSEWRDLDTEPATRVIDSYAKKDWSACKDYVAFVEGRCAECGDKPEKVQLCGRCRTAKYCGSKCQKSAWYRHKGVCVPLRKNLTEAKKLVE